jgi:hypothetical protein
MLSDKKFITDGVLNLLMDEVLKRSIEEARKSPKLSVWSPKASIYFGSSSCCFHRRRGRIKL